jgi:hypothetical protein
MYSLSISHGKHKMTAKGVKKAVQEGGVRQAGITHQDYLDCLAAGPSYELQKKRVFTINSTNHTLYTNETEKLTLSPNDSKLYLVDAYRTLPYGHYSIAALPSS